MRILIAQTTRAERQKITDDAIGQMMGFVMAVRGVFKMYDDYIDGRKELP